MKDISISKGKWNWNVDLNRNVALTEIILPVEGKDNFDVWFIRYRPTKIGLASYLEHGGYTGCRICDVLK